MNIGTLSVIVGTSVLLLTSCGGNKAKQEISPKPIEPEIVSPVDDGKGVGPIKLVMLNEQLDTNLIAEGEKKFNALCAACHSFEDRLIGPNLMGVTNKRKAEWIMNMILNPTEMLEKDPAAKALLMDFEPSRMAPLGLKENDARQLLEYLLSVDKNITSNTTE